jgi:energy-coupling factor transporter ATP-binding protein EcfA2
MDCIPIKNIDDLHVPDDKFGVSFLLVGSTRSGKTTLLNYIYEVYFKKHLVVLMSNSLNSDAYDHIKNKSILADMYHPEVIKDLYAINHGTDNHYKFCVVLDDLTNVKTDKEYKRLLCVMRNQRISCVVSAQGISLFDKTCRGNVNIVLCGRMNSDAEVKKVIEEYLISYFPKNMNMAEKITMYRQMTAGHWWIVIEQVEGNVFRTKLRPEQLLNE